jgi:CHAT domain-containing protein
MRKLFILGILLGYFFQASAQSWIELNNSAIELQEKGDYAKALTQAMAAVDKAKQEYGQNHPDYAQALNTLASITKSVGQYKKAEVFYLEAKKIRERTLGKNHRDYANSLNNLGTFYTTLGQYTIAEKYLLESVDIHKKIFGSDNVYYGISLNAIGVLYKAMKEPEKALPYMISASAILKKPEGGISINYLTTLNNLASVYSDLGLYVKAEDIYTKAKDYSALHFGEKTPTHINLLNNIATVYCETKQFEKALSLFRRSGELCKALLGNKHQEYAVALSNIAETYMRLEKYHLALAPSAEALEIWKNSLGTTHENYANQLFQLAKLYQYAGENKKAEQMLLESAEIHKSKFGTSSLAYAKCMANLAFYYYFLNDVNKAELLFTRTMEIYRARMGDSSEHYSTVANNLAALYLKSNQPAKAATTTILASNGIIKAITQNFLLFSNKDKEEYLEKTRYNADFLNSAISLSANNQSSLAEFGFNQNIMLKSLALSDTRDLRGLLYNSQDTAIQKLFVHWLNLKKMIAKQYSLPVEMRAPDFNQARFLADEMERDLSKKMAGFRQQQEAFKINAAVIKGKMDPDEAVLEFIRFRKFENHWTNNYGYAVYLLRKSDPFPVFIPLFDESQLQKILDSAGKSTVTMVNKIYRGAEIRDKSATALGKSLYQLIWQPLESYLKGIKKVSYSPAGKLYGIAIHALPCDSTRLLIDRYLLNQYSSTRQVALREEYKFSKPQNSVLFGDAVFSLDSLSLVKSRKAKRYDTTYSASVYTPDNRGGYAGTWPELPGTAQELKKINQLLLANQLTVKSFTQRTATEENLKSISGSSPQVLHIATHGFFLPVADKRKDNENVNSYLLAEDPLLRSGLVLTGGNYVWSGKTPIDGIEDGIATAYEISQLNLSNTELVVLSACETALGDVKGSEGVFGLQRAFKMAGAKKMIVSLWQVPDKETAELMTAFYGYWLGGKKIEDAFSQAQTDMRKKYAPYYWAAFVLIE